MSARICKGETVSDWRMLERRPGVVVYYERPYTTLTIPLAKYVYLSGKDIREESNLIEKLRSEKFLYKNDLLVHGVNYEVWYLNLVGSKDWKHWTRDQALTNLQGYSRLQKKETELVAKHNTPRNKIKGGGGSNPKWVNYWRAKLNEVEA